MTEPQNDFDPDTSTTPDGLQTQIDELRERIDVLAAMTNHLRGKYIASMAKQGQTNTRLQQMLDKHIHHVLARDHTGTPLYPVEQGGGGEKGSGHAD